MAFQLFQYVLTLLLGNELFYYMVKQPVYVIVGFLNQDHR